MPRQRKTPTHPLRRPLEEIEMDQPITQSFSTKGFWIAQLLTCLVLALPSAAHERNYGFAWASQATTPSYTPTSSYAHNVSGQAMEISRLAAGQYRVNFDGLEMVGGHVQVTAYGASNNNYCNVASWGETGIFVHCYDTNGVLADTQFTTLFLSPNEYSDNYAYAWASQAANPSYSANSTYAYNAGTGGAVDVQRSSTGTYNVVFSGFASIGEDGAHVQVTAYGSNAHCKVSSWGAANANVLCFDAAGTRVDSEFNVLMWRADEGDNGIAFAWAEEDSNANYSPSEFYRHTPTDSGVTATRSAEGVYNMAFSGFNSGGAGGGHVQVTAYGTDSARCSVSGWTSSAATVRCHDPDGLPTDSRYAVLFLKPPQASFSGIGTTVTTTSPGTLSVGSHVNSISANGNVLVGGLYEASDAEMMRWTRPGGLEFMAGVGIESNGNIPFVGLHASNKTGTELGGYRKSGPRYWSEATGMTSFSPPPLVPAGSFEAISDDSTAFGGNADLGIQVSPWYYTDATGAFFILHPDITALQTYGSVEALSSDGTYAAGWMSQFGGAPSTPTERRAFRWNISTGVQFFPELDPLSGGLSNGISSDGSKVVGVMGRGWGEEAFIWNADTNTTTGLGDIGEPFPNFRDSEAFDITSNGAWVVGRATDGAFFWYEDGSMMLVKDMLEDQGFDLTGWTLTEATAISEDGLVIAGNGINPSGQNEGWIAVPEPDMPWLAWSGVLAAAAMAGHRRRSCGASLNA